MIHCHKFIPSKLRIIGPFAECENRLSAM